MHKQKIYNNFQQFLQKTDTENKKLLKSLFLFYGLMTRVAKGWYISGNLPKIPGRLQKHPGKFPKFLECFRNVLEMFHLFTTLLMSQGLI